MKRPQLIVIGVLAVLVLAAVQIIWQPIKSISVETTSNSSSHICKSNGERCPNVVMWYNWKKSKTGTTTYTYVYGGKKAGWLIVKGLGAIRQEGGRINALLMRPLLVRGSANGTLQIEDLHEELVYGPFGKKGKFRIFKDSLWVGHGAPLIRKLKTVKGGKKHLVHLTSASLSLIAPTFPMPEYPFKG
ncbi:MAG TPA: hypothetical protein VHC21_03330 [Candidatus Saccharimonadales bacterium]|nr:hypothetical protein [Candidatus Saccharimonadales bacterium]